MFSFPVVEYLGMAVLGHVGVFTSQGSCTKGPLKQQTFAVTQFCRLKSEIKVLAGGVG